MIKTTHSLDGLVKKYTEALALNGSIMREVDMKIIKDMERYTPFRSGNLYYSYRVNSKIGSGKITWNTPYARQLFYGKTATGKDINYSKVKSSNAGPRWTERYKANHINEIKSLVERRLKEL